MTETATEPNPGTESVTHTGRAPAPASAGWHQLPLVNLLPPEIIEGRRFARTRRFLIAGLVGSLLVGAAGTVIEQRSVDSARGELDRATSQVASLQLQQQKYRAVPALSAQIEAASAARTAVMSQDVLWYRLLTDMDAARPGGLTTGSIALTLTDTQPATTQTQSDPLTKAGIGSVTFAGSAAAYQGVSAFMEALDAVSGLDSTSLSDASRDQNGTIDYTVSSVVTDGALSHRYTAKGH